MNRLSLMFLLAALLSQAGALGREVGQDQDPAAARTSDQDAESTASETDSGQVFYATATVEAKAIDTATATVTILEESEIEALEAVHVGDLLPWIPGLLVTGPATRAGLTTARIRGGDPNFTLVLVDGVPLNDSTDPLGGAFNLAGLAVTDVERVEVVRGPLSTYFGSTGLSGAINVITRGATQKRLNVDLQAGTSSSARSSVSFSHPGTEIDTSFSALWEREEGVIGADRFEHKAVVAGFGLQPSASSQLDVRTRISSVEGDDYPESSGGPVYGSGNLRRSQYDELSLGVELDLGGDTSSIPHRFRASVFSRSSERDSPAILPIVPESRETNTYTDLRLAWDSLVPLARSIRLSFGADLNREQGESDSLLLLPPELGGELAGDYSIDRTTTGGRVELTAGMGNWYLEMGTRLDLPSGSSSEWSPRFGVSYRPANGLVLVRASIGEAFKLPSFYGLASPPALGGNSELEPETALGVDLGIETGFGGETVELGVTLFAIDYENLIDFDFETFRLINRSSVEARGVETTLRWQPVRTLVFSAEATLQDVEDVSSAAELLQEPSWFGGFRVEWRPRPEFSLLFDARSVAESLDRQIPVPERTKVEGYGVIGLSGSWRFDSHWTIHGRCENLSDEDYETEIGFPGVGRSVRLGLRYSLY